MEKNVLLVTGVVQAGDFDDRSVTLFLTGRKLVIQGNDLQIGSLSVEDGNAEITGEFKMLQYCDATPRAKGLLAKVLR